ncbi:MAG: NAD(P)/FAD-dependent oxidoreductase [Flavobacteriales bacterium]|jgi:thioredoxin reductase (NADPH)|tara:strand:- start:6160 stop:7218 length:1059 start_codon:yes stop_codon:yes gene_type:complete
MYKIKTDILIIGAGPVGLFTVFEAGLLGLKCHIIDALEMPGGQCSEIYPKKPIYDIPGTPEIMAGSLIDNLLEQIKPFSPGYTLGETAEKLIKKDDGSFDVITNKGSIHNSKVVAVAGGLGSFEPRKPQIKNINDFEGIGVEYMIKDPMLFKDKNVIISGGGDSALDWTIELCKVAKKVTLIHRRTEFRGAYDSVEKVQALKNKSLINVITPSEVLELNGHDKLESVSIKHNGLDKLIKTDYFIPLFGLIPKLGGVADWGLEIQKNSILVNNALDYQTNIEGVFAIGDINTYPGKLKLILCGFHEATLMCQAAFKIIFPDKKNILKYTTVSGIQGFDGSKRKTDNSIIKSIE